MAQCLEQRGASCPATLSWAQEFLVVFTPPPGFKWKLTLPSDTTSSATLWSRTCSFSSCCFRALLKIVEEEGLEAFGMWCATEGWRGAQRGKNNGRRQLAQENSYLDLSLDLKKWDSWKKRYWAKVIEQKFQNGFAAMMGSCSQSCLWWKVPTMISNLQSGGFSRTGLLLLAGQSLTNSSLQPLWDLDGFKYWFRSIL